MRKYSLNESFFESIDTEEKAYWLGFITADGNITTSGGAVKIVLQRRDIEHLRKFAMALNYTGRIIEYEKQNHRKAEQILPYCRIVITSVRLARDLGVLGVLPNKCHTLKPWSGSDSLMRHYWRGLVDGDGTIVKNKCNGLWKVSLAGNEFVIERFREFVAIHCGSKATPKKYQGVLRFDVCGRLMPQTVLRLLYENSTVSLDRKMELAQELLSIQCRTRQESCRLRFASLTPQHFN